MSEISAITAIHFGSTPGFGHGTERCSMAGMSIITVRNRARVYYEDMERDKGCPSFCVQMVHLHQYTTVQIHPWALLLPILQR
jgi:hypothetical protein